VEVRAAARTAAAQAGLLIGLMEQEHERAAGAWQAEWPAISEVLLVSAGAVGRAREMVEGLVVFERTMLANLERGADLMLAESVTMALAARVGRPRAQELVRAAVGRLAAGGDGLSSQLLADPSIAAQLSPDEIAAALEPGSYLGSSDALIDRALAAHAMARPGSGER
jgi:3-carboxy-cis,cis-muconate cycloisomerase